MTKLILDGERSRLRLGLAKSLLRRIQAAGIPVKTIEVDGFRISVRVDPPTIKIVAPPLAVVVICTQANHARWFMSEGLGSALIAHDLTYCAAVDANGDCTDMRLLATTLAHYEGVACLACSSSALISEILEFYNVFFDYARGATTHSFIVQIAALCYGALKNNGSGISTPTSLPPRRDVAWSAQSVRTGYVVASPVLQRLVSDHWLAMYRWGSTLNTSVAPTPISYTLYSDAFLSAFFTDQVTPAPQTSAVWRASIFVIVDAADYVEIGILFWVVEGAIGVIPETAPYASMSLVRMTISLVSNTVNASQTWYAQRKPITALSFDGSIIAGAPCAPLFNRIQFIDVDGVSTLWGLWVAAHVDPTKATAGSIRLDHIPLVNPATGEASFQYEFVKNGLGTYIFPPELLGALVRPNYAIFMRAGQPLWFLVFQQFAAPTGLENYVLSAYIGTPWSGWAPFVLPTEGVVRDVRLLRYDVSGTDVSLEALALVETVDTVTSAKILQVMHLDTTSATGWVDAGVLQADQVPSDPALWRLAMYGDGTAAYYHPEGRIPDLPQIPVVL